MHFANGDVQSGSFSASPVAISWFYACIAIKPLQVSNKKQESLKIIRCQNRETENRENLDNNPYPFYLPCEFLENDKNLEKIKQKLLSFQIAIGCTNVHPKPNSVLM